jgi:nucleoside-diphosphate-sugar epimerase
MAREWTIGGAIRSISAAVVSPVTGATGFVGSRLVRVLAGRSDHVRALVRAGSDPRRLAGAGPEVETVEGDVTDAASLRSAMAGVERVFHCAGVHEIGSSDTTRMRAVNVGGTQNVLRAAAERRILAVHVSCVVALGPTRPGELADESHWTGDTPRSVYEATRREAHSIARSMARAGARLRIAVPVAIYGPDDPGLTGRAHAWLARGAMPVAALGAMPMTLVHVDDCAEGLALVAERATDGSEYILGGACVTFREWFTLAARLAGRRPPAVWLPDVMVRGVAAASRVASPRVREALAMSSGARWAFRADRAKRDLGWVPRSLEEGLRETMGFYRGT